MFYLGSATDGATINKTFSANDLFATVQRTAPHFKAAAGQENVFMCMMPPGASLAGFSGDLGAHFSDAPLRNYTGFVDNGTLNVMTSVLAHEVAETGTDPGAGDGWLMNRSFFGDGAVTEIADAAQGLCDYVNGVWVQAYWQQSVSACAIPFGDPRQVAGGALTSAFDGTHTHVFYTTNDGHIHDLYGSAGSWIPLDVTQAAGAPLANGGTALTSYWERSGGVGHVFYFGTDGYVKELYFVNGAWYPNSPTSLHLDPGVAPLRALSGFFNIADNTQHVLYAPGGGGASYLRELKWTATSGWTVATPIPGATSNAFPSTTTQICSEFDGMQHAFYFDASNHVREIVSSTGGAWQTNDWTAIFNSTIPLPGRDAIAASGDGVTFMGPISHVYYIDTVNHVWQLTRFAGRYFGEDLTSATAIRRRREPLR